MIKEAYCSYEIAKLLKEKGFDIPCNAYWFIGEDVTFRVDGEPINWNDVKATLEWLSCPTLQMVMAWLREKDIDLCIHPDFPRSMDYTIEFYENGEPGGCCGNYKTYEEASEEAIKYALKNLI